MPALSLAPMLLGSIICRRVNNQLWRCRIVETEAYTLMDKASHSYKKRQGSEPMFAAAGTIYMYRIRQWNSLNISALEAGAGVLIKAAVPYFERISQVRWLHPHLHHRPLRRVLGGQGLLCRALNLSVPDWNGQQFGPDLYLEEDDHKPAEILVTPRLGVSVNRELPYRFVDKFWLASTTLPYIKQSWREKELMKICRDVVEASRFANLFSPA